MAGARRNAVMVRVTDAELELLTGSAGRLGLKVAEYVRRSAVEVATATSAFAGSDSSPTEAHVVAAHWVAAGDSDRATALAGSPASSPPTT